RGFLQISLDQTPRFHCRCRKENDCLTVAGRVFSQTLCKAMRWFNVNEFRTRLHQPWFGSRIGAVLVALAGVCLLLFPFGKGLRDWSYDLPFLLRLQKGFHTN